MNGSKVGGRGAQGRERMQQGEQEAKSSAALSDRHTRLLAVRRAQRQAETSRAPGELRGGQRARNTVCGTRSAVYSLQQRAQKRQPNWKAFARANCNFGRLHSIAVAAQWRNKDSHSAGPANKSQFHRSFAGSKMICTQTGAQLASVVASVAPSWWGLTCSFCLEGAFPAHSSRGGKGAHFGDCVGQCLVQLAGRQNEETKTTTTTKKRKDTLQP